MFDIETMIRYHLQYNFYPPLSEALVPCAVEAYELYREVVADGGHHDDERWEQMISCTEDTFTTLAQAVDFFNLDRI